MTRTRRALAWSAVGFGVQVSGQAVRAFMLAGLLAPAELGQFFLLRSLVSVFALFGQLGLGTVALRRIAAASESASKKFIVQRAKRLILTVAAASAATVALGAPLFGFSLIAAAALSVLTFSAAIVPSLADLLRGLGSTSRAVLIDRGVTTMADLGALTGALLWLGSSSLEIVLVLMAVASIVPVAVVVSALRHHPSPAVHQEQIEDVGTLLSESWPVTANALLWRGLAEADLWVVAWRAGATSAAIYGIAIRLATPIQAVLGLGSYVLAARVSALEAAGDRAGLQRLLQRAARWMGGLALLALLVVAALDARVIARAFGPAYTSAAPLVLILGAAQVINAAAGLGGTTLLMIGRQRALMSISLMTVAVTVVGAWLLTGLYGVVGAAIASAVAVVTQNILMIVAVRRYAGVRVDALPARSAGPTS